MRITRGLAGILLAIGLVFLAAGSTSWEGVAQGATLNVTTTADEDDGACGTDCSLREAIAAAVSGDTINIPAGTYNLISGAGFNELTINKNLTLTGAGQSSTTIQRSTAVNTPFFRVFNITAGTVTISGVTIARGDEGSPGGGILTASGTVTRLD